MRLGYCCCDPGDNRFARRGGGGPWASGVGRVRDGPYIAVRGAVVRMIRWPAVGCRTRRVARHAAPWAVVNRPVPVEYVTVLWVLKLLS